jgi:hypothetical protein
MKLDLEGFGRELHEFKAARTARLAVETRVFNCRRHRIGNKSPPNSSPWPPGIPGASCGAAADSRDPRAQMAETLTSVHSNT